MVGAFLVGLGLVISATGGWLIARPHMPAAGDGAGPAAVDALHAEVDASLRSRARALESKAKDAAHVQELIAAVEIGADANTFDDLLTTEEWWAPYRSEFRVNGVVSADGPLATLGPALTDPTNLRIVRQARNDGAASGIAPGREGAFFVAAARIGRGKRAAKGLVVFLGLPVDQSDLQAAVSGSTAIAAVAIADDRHLLSTAGPAAAHPALMELLGKPAPGISELTQGGQGAVWPFDDGLRLLALLPARAPVKTPLSGKPAAPILVVGIATVIMGIALRLTRRNRATGATGGHPLEGPATTPMVASRPPLAGGGPQKQWSPVIVSSSNPPPQPLPPQPLPPPARGASAVQKRSDAAGWPVQMGRYELLERIGEGGMADVCIAAAHGVEGFVRRFVIKRMHPHLARNREAVNQFIDEARLQSGLVHSNIVPVYDFGKVDEEYFIALEYIHGRDLDRVVRRHMEVFGRPLSVPVAFFIVQEVLEALAYAHTRTDPNGKLLEIVHRDVTPGNILISFRGEVKLSDFGIAKSDRRVSKTELGTLKGNAAFMSPEQARGEPVDSRSDLFSAGVVLFHCLTGQFLYGGDDAMLKRLLRAALGPATSELNQIDQIPDIAAGVIRRALAFDPKERFQVARDFSRELVGRYTGGRSELADLMAELFPDPQGEAR